MIKQLRGHGHNTQELEGKWREFEARLEAFQEKIAG
jgi:hypothetical protein